MSTPIQPQVVIIKIPKNPGVAAALGFFFGPIGLLYVGLAPALIMLGVNLLVALFTLGFGLFLTWPVCALVGWSRANYFNKQLAEGRA